MYQKKDLKPELQINNNKLVKLLLASELINNHDKNNLKKTSSKMHNILDKNNIVHGDKFQPLQKLSINNHKTVKLLLAPDLINNHDKNNLKITSRIMYNIID